MNAEDINNENYSNILNKDLQHSLEIDYLSDCELKGIGWDERNHVFIIQATCLATGDLIDSYNYSYKREYEQDLKTIKK